MDRIYPSLNELQRDMDASMIQGLLEDRDLGIQRNKEMEGSIGLVLQSLNKLETIIDILWGSSGRIKILKCVKI